MASVDELVQLLKGLPPAAIDALAKDINAKAESIKARAEQEARLNASKAQIQQALAGIAKTIPNFDVHVRNGNVEVRLVGAGGGKVSSPQSTPVRDFCAKHGLKSGREIVEKYLPEEISRYDELDSNAKYQLQLRAIRIAEGRDKQG